MIARTVGLGPLGLLTGTILDEVFFFQRGLGVEPTLVITALIGAALTAEIAPTRRASSTGERSPSQPRR